MSCPLYEQITVDMKNAMKAKDQAKVLLLRGVLGKIQNENVLRGKDITDDLCVRCVNKTISELEQSIESFAKAGREEDVQKLKADLSAVSVYRPKQLSEEEVVSFVKEAIASLGASSKKDMGKVMQAVMAAHGKETDGKTVSRIASGLLSL